MSITFINPPLPDDGSCAQCHGPREAHLSKKAGTNKVAIFEAASDPFCSADCCRLYFGVINQDEFARRSKMDGSQSGRGETAGDVHPR